MSKSELRDLYLTKRKALSNKEVIQKSEQICKKLIQFFKQRPFLNIVGYSPIHNEPKLTTFLRWAHQNHHIYMPKYSDNTYQLVQITLNTHYTTGKYNILEPTTTTPLLKPSQTESTNTCFLVPGIIFDKQGARIGYGKGIYDQLLQRFNGFRVGIAYNFQMINNIPQEKHDINMDTLITD